MYNLVARVKSSLFLKSKFAYANLWEGQVTLDKLLSGKSAYITKINGQGELRHRLLDMGLIPNTKVKTVKLAPLGDPMEINLRGYDLTIRLDDAKQIEIKEDIL